MSVSGPQHRWCVWIGLLSLLIMAAVQEGQWLSPSCSPTSDKAIHARQKVGRPAFIEI